MSNRSSHHFVALDFYRFIAATAVVVYHIALHDHEHGRLFPWVEKFNLFVDFFFVLSGFVIAHGYADRVDSWPGIATFMRRRFARLYPLHLLTLSLFLGAIAVMAALHKAPPNPEKYSLSLLPGQILLMQSWPLNAPLQFNYPAWSISVEFAMYLLFPLLMLCRRRAGIASMVAIAGLGFVALEVLWARGVMTAPYWDENYSPLRGLPTFTLGIIIAQVYNKVRHGVALGALALLSGAILMVAHASDYLIIATFVAAVFLTASGEVATPDHALNRPIVRTLGDASYGIYMLHAFVLMAFFTFVWKGREDAPGPVYVAGLVVLVIALAIVIFTAFEKPMRDWLSGRRPKPAPSLHRAGPLSETPAKTLR
ncbi:acyltransferase family protein [Bradyrhizobium sp. ORS 86]|uniref:acyltransferase family protein n=1 Tax=Bradyrhizobium sp. ORS 86 TaxID=1685970 RepID=UPI0038906A76